MTGWQLSTANTCAVMTLCDIDGIDSVKFLCGGEPYSINGGGIMTSEDVVTNDLALNPIETELTLYFLQNGLLVPEKRKIISLENEFVGPYVIGELISGPKTKGLSPTIPRDSRLVSISQSEGICTINLSVTFLSGIEKSRQIEVAALSSITESLCAIDGISGVHFLVDGDQLYGSAIMQPNGTMLAGESNKPVIFTAYMPNRDGTALEPVTAAMAPVEEKSTEELIMLRLAGGIDRCGFLSAFKGCALFSKAYLYGSAYIVDFTGASELAPAEGVSEDLLIQSIVLTITENLIYAKTVRIYAGGELVGEYSPDYSKIKTEINN
jgi:spore germination protein GerM